MPTFHVKNSILSYKVKIDYSHPQQLVTLGIHSFTSLDSTIFKLFHQGNSNTAQNLQYMNAKQPLSLLPGNPPAPP